MTTFYVIRKPFAKVFFFGTLEECFDFLVKFEDPMQFSVLNESDAEEYLMRE